MNDPATSTGLTQATEPCWILQDARGVWEERHYATQHEAEEAMRRDAEADDGSGPDELRHGETGCWSAIAVCGTVFDADGDGVQHLRGDTLAEAEAFLRSTDWKTGEDGRWRCPTDTSCECWPEDVDG